RLLSGTCSATYTAAPPYSPPSASPCSRRRTRRISGAATPIVAYVGVRPMRNVDSPMIVSVTKEGVLAANQVADSAEDDRAEGAHQKASGEQRPVFDGRPGRAVRGKHQLRQDGVQAAEDVEVVPLDHRAQSRGEDDPFDRVVAALVHQSSSCDYI